MIKQLELKKKTGNCIGNITKSITYINNKYIENMKDSISTRYILRISVFNKSYSMDSVNFWIK